MKRAIEISLNGTETGANPRVGCVAVRNGKIIASGFHACCGGPHAERAAFEDARQNGTSLRGSTVYVTLEPCSHFGRTPPCAPLLVEAGVERVVIGMLDPNPKVDGGGAAILKDAGIEVHMIGGELEAECRWINRGFIRHHTLGRPWITLKMAVSLDGMLALADGTSKWLTCEEARTEAHVMRAEHDGILAGVGTVLADDPELTVRLSDNKNKSPRRVILDSRLRTPIDAKAVPGSIIFCSAEEVHRTGECDSHTEVSCLDKKARFLGLAEVVEVDAAEGKLDLSEVLGFLAENGIQRLLVEGGAAVHSSFLDGGFADSAAVFIAPKFLGAGLGVTRALHAANMRDTDRFELDSPAVRKIGKDILIEGKFKSAPPL